MKLESEKPETIAIIAGQLVVGGSERQLYLWLSHLNREFLNPVVLTLHPGEGDYWEEPVESLGIPLVRITRRKSRMLRLFEIVRVLHTYKPRLIHGWHLFASPYAGAAGLLLGAKSLGSLRTSYQAFQDNPAQSLPTLWLVDAIVVNSYSAAKQLSDSKKRRNQAIYQVFNALETSTGDRQTLRSELSRRFDIPPAAFWIGMLGRLYPKKRFDSLMEIFVVVKEKVPDSYLILIGDGPERKYLEKLAEELAISNHTIFTGEIPLASPWLKALDIFCFTSVEEGLPNTVMEAAAAGLPIVAWDLPFNREIVEHGKSALLVEPENLLAFRDALLCLCTSQQLREELGAAARKRVLAEFTVDRFVKGMTFVYEDLLGRSREDRQNRDDFRIS